MCRCVMPRLRAVSRVRSSSAEPTPWLCQSCSTLKAASASLDMRPADRPQFGRAAQLPVHEKAVHDRCRATSRVST